MDEVFAIGPPLLSKLAIASFGLIVFFNMIPGIVKGVIIAMKTNSEFESFVIRHFSTWSDLYELHKDKQFIRQIRDEQGWKNRPI